jgi:hypothetical protein
MATTTNFGWETPDDTDLVKDGAAAIRTALGGVDTSFVDLKGGTTGQVLAKASNTDLDFVWSADAAGMTNPMTTTGDTIYSSSGSTPARLGIGTTGQVLTVAGGVPAWASPSSGGMTVLASGSLSGSAVNLTGISSGYIDLKLVIRNYIPATDATYMEMRLNNDSTSNYYPLTYTVLSNEIFAGESFALSKQAISQQQDNAVSQSIIVVDLRDYANTTTWKMGETVGYTNDDANTAKFNARGGFFIYGGTSAISQINLINNSGNFTSGTYTLYGVK